MDKQIAAGSVFMCRLCNQFSPSHSLLVDHCSQLHPLQEPHEDIIVALQPLAGVPLATLAETSVKRKRGRPKGSTNKVRKYQREGREDVALSPVGKVQRQEGQKEEADTQGMAPNGDDNKIAELKCNDCHRLFSNRRQIVKHICLKAQFEEEEDDDDDTGSKRSGLEDCENLDPEGPDKTQKQQSPKTSGTKGRIGMKSFQTSKCSKSSQILSNGERLPTSKDDESGSKKSLIDVLLTEDESLPGVIKMIPVENISGVSEYLNSSGGFRNAAVPQDDAEDIASQSAAGVEDPKADQDPSSDRTEITPGKGFLEYSVKQDVPNLIPSQLKVFGCEFCNKIFKFRHSLMSHLRTHTQEKPFKCPHCDYASSIKANLNVHLRKHTGEKFSCQQCAFKCLNPGHLKVHVERVHLKVKQHCGFCQKKYSDVKNLIKHIEKSHNLKDPLIQKSYQQLRLKTRQGLRQLLYHCPTCSRCFKNQMERERHLLVHGPQRPFACSLCDQAKTCLATLAAHVRKHPFLYVCRTCEGNFVSSQRLKRHLLEVHPELEQEEAFKECIKNSFYLMNGGKILPVEEEREGRERGLNAEGDAELRDESREDLMRTGEDGEEWRDGEDDPQKAAAAAPEDADRAESHAETVQADWTGEGFTQKQEVKSVAEKQNDGRVESSATALAHDSAESDKPGHEPHSEDATADPDVQLADDRESAANTPVNNFIPRAPLPSAPSEEDAQTAQSEQDFQLSAFQQVLLSLPKTLLDMETFQQLRKIYGDLECQYCGKLFWYKVHYNAHVRTHTKEHLHYCSKCNYSSITKSSLTRHLIQKHSGVLLPCSSPGCKYTTPDKYKLRAHQTKHQKEGKSAPCPICQKTCPEHRLKQHIQVLHPDAVPVKGQKVKRAEKCPYCESYYLKNSSEFQQHIWAHQGVKPFVCNICDYASRSRNNLKNHMNRHSSERSHICELCGKTFKSKMSLKSHRLSHTDQGKQFSCSECDFSSALKAPLLRHMEQHARFKPFQCGHCLYSCNTSGPLKRHYKTKHPGQEYQNVGEGLSDAEYSAQQAIKCPECRFVYGTKWELNRHMKKKHGTKETECTWEVEETVDSQFVPLDQEEEMTEEQAALQDNGTDNILQQIVELSSETHDAITSMVAMAPGTVAVVEQVVDEEEAGDHQLMVVDADGDLSAEQVMVVEEGQELEALRVLTQDYSTQHFIVYVQEQTVEINS
ncbi:zinc finger protein ZFAT-like isoform X2 [Syngnathoides biaculeatus]|uniref:zinc finger protein ZFAT-like isoform X2 n=1 Tax=Syngnathoides biaculeatus TaxID=300417 RepID=UPI002ADD5592|nr:zinc finger protein ZFAT-like isoform X2 [Syngnathoides biaculeatus]XP_061676574.1 zinc finger protein ZFAT-like isoform X2 [Syngnathoides biaculeatus]